MGTARQRNASRTATRGAVPGRTRRGRIAGALLLVVLFVASAAGPAAVGGAPTGSARAPSLPAPASWTGGSQNVTGCDGILWNSSLVRNYSPAYCYGHDEPTMSYFSSAPGTGGNASFEFILPRSYVARSQGDLYATFWLGGVVYNASSLDQQAFFELQFYPSAPQATGPNSGSVDCGSDGSFSASWVAGSNDWFVCTPVWGLIGSSEVNVAQAAPLDNYAAGSDSILVMHSGDTIFVNESSKGRTEPWTFDIADATTHLNGTIRLRDPNGVGLGPFYATAAYGNNLTWAASGAGTISFAYEIGHALNSSIPEPDPTWGSCDPNGTDCYSYAPSAWAASGQMQLSLPKMGPGGSAGYPDGMGFSSSQGGEAEVNASACGAPSFTAFNCMYPYFMYRAANYSFDFGAANVTNTTHNYGYVYQFPGNAATQHASPPWGWLNVSVTPSNAVVEINRLGQANPLPYQASGVYDGQYMEGLYWINASFPGRFPTSREVYLPTGGHLNESLAVAPYQITFHEIGLPSGTNWSVRSTGPLNSTLTTDTPSLSLPAFNGSYRFSIASSFAPYVAAPAVGAVTVAGENATVNVTFRAPLTINFTEPGDLPTGTIWSVTLRGPVNESGSSANATILLPVVNGTYDYAVSRPGWQPSPGSGTIVIAGASATEPIRFSRVTYAVTFQETGLPSGTWSVAVNGTTLNASVGAPITTFLPNGSFTYRILPIPGWRQTTLPSTGDGVIANGSVAMLTLVYTPVNYLAHFSEEGLPLSTAWSVSVNGTPYTGSGSSIDVPLPNGSYSFSVEGVAGFVAQPARGSFTIANGSATILLQFAARGPSTYPVWFNETGMPIGRAWSVRVGTAAISLPLSSILEYLPNGTAGYSIGGNGSYLAWPYSSGTIAVAGTGATVDIAFDFTVAATFEATGFGSGTPWSVVVSSPTPRSSGAGGPDPTWIVNSSTFTATIALANGSYAFRLVAAGYTAPPGTLTVQGTPPPPVTVSFAPFTYVAVFSATGLPGGHAWQVWLNSTGGGADYHASTGVASVSFSVANGSYTYRFGGVAGYQAVPGYSGGLSVAGSTPAPTAVTYRPFTYPITFSETGLPTGTVWSVAIGSTSVNSTTSTIAIPEPNGTFDFVIGSIGGYATNRSSVTIQVVGGPASVQVSYQAIPPSFLGLPGILGYVLVGGIAAAVVLAIVGLSLVRRRRRAPPRTFPTSPPEDGALAGAGAPPGDPSRATALSAPQAPLVGPPSPPSYPSAPPVASPAPSPEPISASFPAVVAEPPPPALARDSSTSGVAPPPAPAPGSDAGPPLPPSVFCPACGRLFRPGSRFCMGCGRPRE